MTDTLTTTRPAITRPDHIHVCADTTPGVHRTDSDEIFWWLPVIGPTATVLAQVLARHTPTGGATWDTGKLARRIGLSGNRSKLWVSLNRLHQFGAAQFHATDVLTVRTMLPSLTDRQLAKLPDDLAASYPHRSMSDVVHRREVP
jgi:hypothetical protein